MQSIYQFPGLPWLSQHLHEHQNLEHTNNYLHCSRIWQTQDCRKEVTLTDLRNLICSKELGYTPWCPILPHHWEISCGYHTRIEILTPRNSLPFSSADLSMCPCCTLAHMRYLKLTEEKSSHPILSLYHTNHRIGKCVQVHMVCSYTNKHIVAYLLLVIETTMSEADNWREHFERWQAACNWENTSKLNDYFWMWKVYKHAVSLINMQSYTYLSNFISSIC